jgi:leader peptidase (prepilin peptidase)/N-methyltransferase
LPCTCRFSNWVPWYQGSPRYLPDLAISCETLMTEPVYLQWLIYAAMTWLFLSVGSFLNVVIYRLPVMLQREWLIWAGDIISEYGPKRDEKETNENPDAQPVKKQEAFNLAVPRSRCPNCNHLISALQNIPIVSWILLRGRCANCKSPISARYPFVELLTCIMSFIVISAYGITWLGFSYLALTWMLIALALIDYDTMLLPDNMTLPLLWMGLFMNLVLGPEGGAVGIEAAIVGALAGYLLLWTVFWAFKLVTGKDGMGYGDFKLLAALGAWLGWQVLPLTILLSAVAGLIIGGGLMLTKVLKRENPIPFGPFLAIAGWIMLIWSDPLIALI